MTPRSACWLLPAIGMFLAACAPLNQPLSASAKSRIRSVHVQLVVPQESFTFSAPAPDASAIGGLIGALIESNVQKSRQATMRSYIEPVLDEMLDADFRAEARAALPGATTGFPLPVSRADLVAIAPSRKEHESLMLRKQGDEAYLRVVMQYAMDLDSGALVTRSHVSLWQPGQTSPSFVGSAIVHGVPLSPGDRVASMRRQMREAVAHTMRLAALDISQPATEATRPRQPIVFEAGGALVTLQAEVLAAEASRAFIRSADGAMFSVQR